MSEIQIKDYPDFVKDTQSNAILNSNYVALQERKRQKELQNNITTLNNDVSVLKDELSEIKSLLRILVNK